MDELPWKLADDKTWTVSHFILKNITTNCKQMNVLKKKKTKNVCIILE